MNFYKLFGMPNFIYYSISFCIVVLSYLVRTVVIWLANMITFKSDSRRSSLFVIFVFAVFFNNYGLVYLIAPLSIPIPILEFYFVGIYPDFNYAWFEDIGGQIIYVAFLNAIMPPITLVCDLLYHFTMHAID